MTDHPTPATPEATEREARELADARNGLLEAMAATPRNSDAAGVIGKSVDCLEAAVRRAERELIAGIVEGMEVTANTRYTGERFGVGLVSKDALLAKLREEA